MHITNSIDSHFAPLNGSKHSRHSSTLQPLEHPSSIPGSTPPFKASRHNGSYILSSMSERPGITRYQSPTVSDLNKSQTTRLDSVTYDHPPEARRLSKWPSDQRDLQQRGLTTSNEPRLSSQATGKISSKTLPISSSMYADTSNAATGGSKSRSKTRSSLYGSKENYPRGAGTASGDFVSPNSNKEKPSARGRRDRSGKRRDPNDISETGLGSTRLVDEQNGSVEEGGTLKGRVVLTERVGPGKQAYEENYVVSRKEKENRKKRDKKGGSKYKDTNPESTSSGEKERRTKENNEKERSRSPYDEGHHYRKGSYGGYIQYGQDTEENWYIHQKSKRLEEEVREKEQRLGQMEKFQDQLYQSYVEAKGELEKSREEIESLMDNIDLYVNQNEALKRKLAQMEEQEMQLASENQRLRESQTHRGEVIDSLEKQVEKLKVEVMSLTRRCSEQAESFGSKIKRIEREKQEVIHEKEKLERRVEEQMQGLGGLEDKSMLMKSIEDKSYQLRTYRRRNEELNEEVERLRKQNEEIMKRQQQATERQEESVERENKGKRTKKSIDLGEIGKILGRVMQEIGVDDVNQVVQKVQEIQEGNRTNNKFVSAIADLVYSCSPKGYFETKPTSRQAWKWLQKLMQEYMMMKKQKGNGKEGAEGTVEKDIVKGLVEFLKVEDKGIVLEKVKAMAVENSLLQKQVDKMKGSGLENSFAILGDREKLIDGHAMSYSSYSGAPSTAKFEETQKFQKGLKELSFGRASGPKLKKMMDKDGMELAAAGELMENKESG